MALDAKGNELEFDANAGFWNTGNTIKMPVDAGLYALSQYYSELNFLYADADTPNEVTFAQLSAIDLTGIDEKDFRFTLKNGTIKDLASNPYDSEGNLKY